MLEYKGFRGRVDIDNGEDAFTGEVDGIRDVVTFEGRTPVEVKIAFRASVEDYLAMGGAAPVAADGYSGPCPKPPLSAPAAGASEDAGNIVRFIDMVRLIKAKLSVADGSYAAEDVRRVRDGIQILADHGCNALAAPSAAGASETGRICPLCDHPDDGQRFCPADGSAWRSPQQALCWLRSERIRLLELAAVRATPAPPVPPAAPAVPIKPVHWRRWAVIGPDGDARRICMTEGDACETACGDEEVQEVAVYPVDAPAPAVRTPDAEPLPEVRAEDVAKFRRSVRGIGMEHITDDRADEFLSGQVALDVSRRILAALEAVQARQTEGR